MTLETTTFWGFNFGQELLEAMEERRKETERFGNEFLDILDWLEMSVLYVQHVISGTYEYMLKTIFHNEEFSRMN